MASKVGDGPRGGGAAKTCSKHANGSDSQTQGLTGCDGNGQSWPCAKENSGNDDQHACRLHANRDVRKSVLTRAPTGFYGADRCLDVGRSDR
jgi:hypothetical protein